MFKTLKIQGFQSWTKAHFNFSPGLNVILGDSQAGKSAVLKAILWGATNRPMSDNILNKDIITPRSTVSISTTEGESVRLTKKFGKPTNATYTVNGTPLRKFKTSVPDEVDAVFKLSNVNLQKQGDPPFLIASSSGAILKEINKITKLEKSDKWIKSLTSKIDKTNAQIKYAQSDVDILVLGLKSYEGLEDLEDDIERLDKLSEEIDELESNQDEIRSAFKKWKSIKSNIKNVTNSYALLKKEFHNLQELDAEVHKLENLLEKLSKFAQVTKSVELAEEELENLIDLYKRKLTKRGKCPTCQTNISKTLISRLEF